MLKDAGNAGDRAFGSLFRRCRKRPVAEHRLGSHSRRHLRRSLDDGTDDASATARVSFKWTVEKTVPDYVGVTAVSCPTAKLCVAVDGYGDVITSRDPLGGAAHWSSTNIDNPAKTGQSCPSNPGDDCGLVDVSCPKTSFCAALDGAGDIFTSSDPTGAPSSWKVAPNVSGNNQIVMLGVSCASASLCVVGGEEGYVLASGDPAGGKSAWRVTHLSSQLSFSGVSCPSPKLCVLGGEDTASLGYVFTSTDPTGGASKWSGEQISQDSNPGSDVSSVACRTVSLCIGADYGDGYIFVSTKPAARWRNVRAPKTDRAPGAQVGASCSRTGLLCAVVDIYGHVFASSTPTGGTSAWSVSSLPTSADQPAGISCPTASLCVIAAQQGIVAGIAHVARPPRPKLTVGRIKGLGRRIGSRSRSTAPCRAGRTARSASMSTPSSTTAPCRSVRRTGSRSRAGGSFTSI